MEKLREQKCEACRRGAPPATSEEIAAFRDQIPEWEILTVEGIELLSRTFPFRNFGEALDFTNRVGELAETEGHHPSILTEWGKVTVQWWTHKIRGIHRNDLIMAAKTDTLQG
ncbi:MAG: 4a-hydroxytetrahydrobiopterin dehydratase [Syntrophotaleaceae bacterium]